MLKCAYAQTMQAILACTCTTCKIWDEISYKRSCLWKKGCQPSIRWLNCWSLLKLMLPESSTGVWVICFWFDWAQNCKLVNHIMGLKSFVKPSGDWPKRTYEEKGQPKLTQYGRGGVKIPIFVRTSYMDAPFLILSCSVVNVIHPILFLNVQYAIL